VKGWKGYSLKTGAGDMNAAPAALDKPNTNTRRKHPLRLAY
jgi:hypothetical protein